MRHFVYASTMVAGTVAAIIPSEASSAWEISSSWGASSAWETSSPGERSPAAWSTLWPSAPTPSASPDDDKSSMRLMSPDPEFPTDPGVTPYCTWWLNLEGSSWEPTCEDVHEFYWVTREEFIRWNPILRDSCSAYVPGKSFCVEAFGAPEEPPTTSTRPTTTVAPVTTTSPPVTTTTTSAGNGISTPIPVQDGMIGTCNRFYLVKTNELCTTIVANHGITLAQFAAWNPAVGGTGCPTLWANTYACVGIIGFTPVTTTTRPATTTSAGNGISTPSPIQDGMTKSCNRFYLVKTNELCATIVANHGITIAQFVSWNPAVGGAGCPSLWANTYACVGIIGSTPVTTTAGPTTTAPTPIRTAQKPSPTQPNQASNCYRWYKARSGQICETIASLTGASMSDILRWNPSVGSNCQSMWADNYLCVGARNSLPTYYSHGCHFEPSTTRGLTAASMMAQPALNVEYCAVWCLADRGSTIFGVQSSNQCYCGNSMSEGAIKVPESECNRACTGNEAQKCGGAWRSNIYSTSATPPVTYKHHGCATDANNGFTFGRALRTSNTMNVAECANFCFVDRGTSKFGLRNGRECHCGENMGVGARYVATSECSMNCAGNSSQKCGAGNRVSIYSKEMNAPPTQ